MNRFMTAEGTEKLNLFGWPCDKDGEIVGEYIARRSKMGSHIDWFYTKKGSVSCPLHAPHMVFGPIPF